MTIRTTYSVNGMTCDHCVHAVSEELSALPGVQSVEVSLVPGAESTVVVTSATALSDDSVRDAVDEAGYELATTST